MPATWLEGSAPPRACGAFCFVRDQMRFFVPFQVDSSMLYCFNHEAKQAPPQAKSPPKTAMKCTEPGAAAAQCALLDNSASVLS